MFKNINFVTTHPKNNQQFSQLIQPFSQSVSQYEIYLWTKLKKKKKITTKPTTDVLIEIWAVYYFFLLNVNIIAGCCLFNKFFLIFFFGFLPTTCVCFFKTLKGVRKFLYSKDLFCLCQLFYTVFSIYIWH